MNFQEKFRTRGGQVVRFAYDPKLLARYVQEHTEVVSFPISDSEGWNGHAITPRRNNWQKAREVNGVRITDNQGRQLRRWANEVKAASFNAAYNLFNALDLSLLEFEDWAQEQGLDPVLWDDTNTE